MDIHPDPNVSLLRGYRVDQQRRGLEKSTLDARETRLRSFGLWLGRSLLTATKDDVETFLDRKPLAARTRYAWVSHLHCFYEWAERDGLTTTDPTARILRPKLRRLIPRPISDADLVLAVSMANHHMLAKLLLAAYAGFRCMEIARLTRDDVLDGYDAPLIVAHGKGSKDRLIPLHADALAALQALPMPRSGLVFRKESGQPFTDQQMSATINEYLDGLGIDATAHQLRHWFGTKLYQRTHDLRLVQEMMGHESPTTTAGYAAYSQAQAASAVGGLGIMPVIAAR